jgi:predicted RNA-binding protein with TRAM domain
MEISDQLRCLFSAKVEKKRGAYVVEIPKRELEVGEIQQGETYRVGLLSTQSTDETEDTETVPDRQRGPQKPPVEEGEQRTVDIEDIGDQGDGITRVERGFVVIVPEAKQGERVTIEITDVRQNVAFAEVVERMDYYE